MPLFRVSLARARRLGCDGDGRDGPRVPPACSEAAKPQRQAGRDTPKLSAPRESIANLIAETLDGQLVGGQDTVRIVNE